MTAAPITEFDIVPTALAVKAMRDNGYKNAAYAIAELMDNSIQAEATEVQLLCADQEVQLDQRSRRRLSEVAVLDNGTGMDSETLQIALQFGNGTRLAGENQTGMGRFGMGLPSASISQCERVDVWSWRDGYESALHTYIDLKEIEKGKLRSLPIPSPEKIPDKWIRAAGRKSFGEAGTLVVWSKIDRILWRTSKALISNSEGLIGRMYRNWIHDGRVTIRLKSFLEDSPEIMIADDVARPNDPMYLMSGTTCPAPYNDKPMFRPFPDPKSYEIPIKIGFRGEEHTVTIRLSLATEEARAESATGGTAGSQEHGKHAAKNVGVSVVRAGRELELDPAWANAYDPRERWWGVEVCFDPGLDELFGVSNNKQSARNLAEAAKVDMTKLVKEHGGSISAARQALREEDDPLEPLVEIAYRIQTNLAVMRKQVQTQAAGRKKQRHARTGPEQQATDAVRKRQDEGHKGLSDEAETKPREEREEELARQLEHAGHSSDFARTLAAETLDKGLKYKIDVASLEGGAFFSVQPRGGVLLVTLNMDHPAYPLLLGARVPSELPDKPEELKERLIAAQSGLEMLLFAWARYEDEQTTPDARRVTQNIRHDWGRMAETFLGSQQ